MLFRWRRVVHRVQAAEGPERVAPEWWREDRSWASGCRDYWRIEDADGRRFWLYREVRAKPAAAPRWFLHGLFA
jgi:protein ImuB